MRRLMLLIVALTYFSTARADTANAFPTLEDAVWAGAFREAARMGSTTQDPEQKRALAHLEEAGALVSKGAPAAARSELRKAAAIPGISAGPSQFWECKMYRREQRDREAADCFQKAGVDEAAGDAAQAAPRRLAGEDGSIHASSIELAAEPRKCAGISCGQAGVPTSPERQKYEGPEPRSSRRLLISAPVSSGASGTTPAK